MLTCFMCIFCQFARHDVVDQTSLVLALLIVWESRKEFPATLMYIVWFAMELLLAFSETLADDWRSA